MREFFYSENKGKVHIAHMHENRLPSNAYKAKRQIEVKHTFSRSFLQSEKVEIIK